MRIAKWLLLAVLALPFLELAAFIAVSAAIGFGLALVLVVSTSLIGWTVLRQAGGNHIARARVAVAEGNFTSLQADGTGGLILLAGFLLLIPGFITDLVGFVLLLAPLRRTLMAALGLYNPRPQRGDGVVDLEPEQWRRVSDPELPKGRDQERQ